MQVLSSIFIAGSLFASHIPLNSNPVPPIENKIAQNDLKKDRKRIKDEKKDLNRFRVLLHDLQTAKRTRDTAALKAVDNRVMRALKAESREEKREVEQAQKEENQSKKELRKQTKKVNRNARKGQFAKASRNEIARRDDQRDLQDDRRDTAMSQAELDETRKIRMAYKMLLGGYDKKSLQQKEHLLERLIRLEQRENARNKVELREDMQEKKEDAIEKRKKRKARRLKKK
jgi:hypothetical protein